MAKYFIETSSNKISSSLLATLQNVARHARTHTARHLQETGLYAGQETIIALLAEHDIMTPGQIAQSIGVRPPTITKSIARLTEQGFVTKSAGHADGRQVQIELTDSGRDILKKAKKAAKKAEKQALKGLSPKQLIRLEAALGTILDNLNTHDEKARDKTAKRSTQAGQEHV